MYGTRTPRHFWDSGTHQPNRHIFNKTSDFEPKQENMAELSIPKSIGTAIDQFDYC